jgi:hypothetical protein
MRTDAAQSLRVIIFREADQWLAQGLERDIAVQAENLRDIVNRLSLAIDAEIAMESFAALGPAPKYFQDLWGPRAGEYTPSAPIALSGAPNLNITLGLAI